MIDLERPENQLLLVQTATDMASCLHGLSIQANLRKGQKRMIELVLKDWQDLVNVLNQPTQNMPEPGSWHNARGVLKNEESTP